MNQLTKTIKALKGEKLPSSNPGKSQIMKTIEALTKKGR